MNEMYSWKFCEIHAYLCILHKFKHKIIDITMKL